MNNEDLKNKILSGITDYLSVEDNTLKSLQTGDLSLLLSNYDEVYQEYKLLSDDDKTGLIKDVRKVRPIVGSNLNVCFTKSADAENNAMEYINKKEEDK